MMDANKRELVLFAVLVVFATAATAQALQFSCC